MFHNLYRKLTEKFLSVIFVPYIEYVFIYIHMYIYIFFIDVFIYIYKIGGLDHASSHLHRLGG